ncbi:hypothetical protein [Micavibrio aeruginosavorus]|uniref:hypothetical protein n=1 Tax=Micavibrio aeruginosavorus TaxID=349221 RepID=UPI003F4ABA6E
MIRTRILLFSLMGMGVVAALLGLAQMWGNVMEWAIFVRTMGTIIVLGTLASFLIAVDYDIPASRRKWLLFLLCGLALGAGGLIVAQIWAQVLDWPVFIKVLITLAVGVGLIGFILAVAEDFGTGKKLRDNHYID